MITIYLNGEPRDIPAETDLAGLLDELSLAAKRIAVELNKNVVRRTDWPATHVREGDRLEIVHFVGGG